MNEGEHIGGVLAIKPGMENVPPVWVPYFMVADTDATAARAKAKGGNLMLPPKDIANVGRFAVIADPQGAVFNVITLAGHK